MSSTTFQDTVTHVPSAWANDVDKLVYGVFAAAQTVAEVRERLGMKGMSSQDSNSVQITGGSIDGVEAGTLVPLTQVIAQSAQVLNGAINGDDVVNLDSMASFVSEKLIEAFNSFSGGFGSMAKQNKNNVSISGGTLDNVDIGTLGRASGAFTALKVSNAPSDGDDVVTLGWLTAHYDIRLNAFKSMANQDSNSVQITGGSIDGVRIGVTNPSTGRFLRATVITAPANNEDIANKRYVDSSISSFASTLGSMAFQKSTNVSITGGAIDGTTIGGSIAASGKFTALTVSANQALIKLNTKSNAVENQSGIVWQDTTTVASFLYQGAQSASNPSTLQLSSSVPVNIHTTGASLALSNANISLTGSRVTLAAPTNNVVVIGAGDPVTGMKLTVAGKAHFAYQQAKRTLLIEGAAKKLDQTYGTTAAGMCPLDANKSAAYEINLTGDAAFSFFDPDTDWPANSWRELELFIRQPIGGKLVAFPSSVKWGGQTPPDYAYTKAGDFDIIRLKTKDGLTWYAESSYANNSYHRQAPVVFIATTSGSQSKLSWDARNAVTVSITGVGIVANIGTVNVPTPTSDTTYTLTAITSDGVTTTATVVVKPAP